MKNLSMMKGFNIVVINLNVLHNYFDSPTKLFSNLLKLNFLAKFIMIDDDKRIISVQEYMSLHKKNDLSKNLDTYT